MQGYSGGRPVLYFLYYLTFLTSTYLAIICIIQNTSKTNSVELNSKLCLICSEETVTISAQCFDLPSTAVYRAPLMLLYVCRVYSRAKKAAKLVHRFGGYLLCGYPYCQYPFDILIPLVPLNSALTFSN